MRINPHLSSLIFGAMMMISGNTGAVSEIKSNFLFGEDGWATSSGIEGLHAPMMLKGVDVGSTDWFFSAPPRFLGDLSKYYGGKLSYRLGFFEYNGDFEGNFDTYIESSKHGMTLVMSGSIVPRSFLNSCSHSANEVRRASEAGRDRRGRRCIVRQD
jgi:hypothetical protein